MNPPNSTVSDFMEKPIGLHGVNVVLRTSFYVLFILFVVVIIVVGLLYFIIKYWLYESQEIKRWLHQSGTYLL